MTHRAPSQPDFKIMIGDEDHQAPIQLCTLHDGQLRDMLAAAGLSADVTPDSPHIRVFHVITQMATTALGTVEVCKYQCPVCAMQQFEYLRKIVAIVANQEVDPLHG